MKPSKSGLLRSSPAWILTLTLPLWLSLPAAWAAPASDVRLLGCWRAERVERVMADGTEWTDAGGCTLQFDAETIVSACALRPGNQPIHYSYRITGPGTYLARITRHPQRPEAEGSERTFEYRVEADRLFVASSSQPASTAAPGASVRVASVSVRVGSATDLQGADDREKAGCSGRLALGVEPRQGDGRNEPASVNAAWLAALR